VTGAFNVLQEPGYAHNRDHWDYSQTLSLVRVAPGYEQPSHDGLTARAVGSLVVPPAPPPATPPALPPRPPPTPPTPLVTPSGDADLMAVLGAAAGLGVLGALPEELTRPLARLLRRVLW
jgi:hypothetical protein